MSLLSFLFADSALEQLALAHQTLFPRGAAQLTQEAQALCRLLGQRLSPISCRHLLIRLKSALAQSVGEVDPIALRARLQTAGGMDLLPTELDAVCTHLTGLSGSAYSGDNGDSFATAVIIHAREPHIGIELEQRWLTEHVGRKYHDWQTQDQALQRRDGRYYDVFALALSSGQKRTVIFDITQFFRPV